MDLGETGWGVYSGSSWLSTGAGEELLWIRWWTFGFWRQGVTYFTYDFCCYITYLVTLQLLTSKKWKQVFTGSRATPTAFVVNTSLCSSGVNSDLWSRGHTELQIAHRVQVIRHDIYCMRRGRKKRKETAGHRTQRPRILLLQVHEL
jgi:hypothetical protein